MHSAELTLFLRYKIVLNLLMHTRHELMKIRLHNKIQIVTTLLLVWINALLQAQQVYQKDQDWPKLMQLYEGRIVEVLSDSTGRIWYADWQGQQINDLKVPKDNSKVAYVYIDSTGKRLSNKVYQNATPFFGGLASVWEQEYLVVPSLKVGKMAFGYETAIINTKEEEVLPMDEWSKYPLGRGLAVKNTYAEPYTTTSVYNKAGKKLAECIDCQVGIGNGNFWMSSPKNSGRPNRVAKLFDLKGRVLYNDSGSYIEPVNNRVPLDEYHLRPIMQSFYRVMKDERKGLSTIIDGTGKVVMDSIGMFYFMSGKCQITKNGFAAIVDTNWNILVPFSYGYTHIQVLPEHPQNAYIVSKNNKTIIINADNKQLIPLESRGSISFNRQGNFYDTYDYTNKRMLVALNGDTLVNPKHFEIVDGWLPDLPGFIVTCRSNGLKTFLDKNGKAIVPCQYDNLFYGGSNRILFFNHDGSSGYMNLEGKVIFSLPGVRRLTTFNRGYAVCEIKVTDKKEFRSQYKIYTGADTPYQLHERVIDTTGQFVACETCPTSLKKLNTLLSDGSSISSFFYKGVALAYNQKTNKHGLVNEKLQFVLPVIYDNINGKAESFQYYWHGERGTYNNIGHQGVSPDIVNGHVKVTLNGVQKWVKIGE